MKRIDASVLGQIMAAQNILFVLPSTEKIAGFFSQSLVSVPGVKACRICFGDVSSQVGSFDSHICTRCKQSHGKNDKDTWFTKESTCALAELPTNQCFTLETIDRRFGFFIFSADQTGLFDLYKPFISNLGNFVALSLENRLQRTDLQEARDVLENKVVERTRQLQLVNTNLKDEIEERKKIETALKDSEDQLKFLFETMVQGVIIQDAESKIVDANDAACEILGLSIDQMLGKTAYDPRWKLIHEDGSPLYPEEMPSNIALRTCKPVFDVLIGSYIPEKNTYHWILTSSTPKFKEGEGKPYLTMTTFTDITERKKAEQDFFLMNFALNNVSEAAYLIDKNANFLFVNDESCSALGYTRDELFCLTVPDIDPDFSMERWRTHWRDLRKKQTMLFEGRHKAKDGSIFPVEVNANYFEYGGRGYNLALVRDITERKLAGEFIETERKRMEIILSSLNTGLSLINPNMTIAWVNKKTREMFPNGEPVGKICHVFYESRETVCEGCGTLKAFLSGKVIESEQLVSSVNRWYNIISIPIKDATGRVVNVLEGITDITERKLADEALQKSEQEFRFLFETMEQGVIIHDAESKVLEANDAACEIMGLSRDQMLGKTAYNPRWKLIHEDGSPFYPEEMPSNIALRTCKPVSDVLVGAYIPDKDIYHWILTSSTPKFKEGDSKPTLTMTTFTNITERKQVEKERQANLHYFESIDRINRAMQRADNLEQMMSDVLDTMLSIFGCDRAFLAVPCDPTMPEFKISMERTSPLYPGAFARGEAVPMSPAVQNLFHELLNNPAPNEIFIGNGLDPNDVVWKTYEIKSQLAIALHPMVGKPWECGLHQCSYNRVWTSQEKRLFMEIGRRIADSLSSLLTYRDLQESEQRYRMVFENSPVSIWEEDFSEVKKMFDNLKKEGITNIENYFNEHPETVWQCIELLKIVDVNQTALAMHSAETKQELIANLAKTFTRESFDTFRQELICLWNGDNEIVTDAVVKTLSGDLQNVTVYVSVCPGYEESLSKILVSLVDVTERKLAEREIHELNQELEQRVLDRTTQLEAANKELEAFSYSVSHDLRAPLRHIDGFIELLQNRAASKFDEQSLHFMDTISDAAKRMGALIDDLLSFSRMGRNEMSKQKVDFNQLVKDVVHEFDPDVKERTVVWQISDLPVIIGDRAMLKVAMVNLVSNALKFTRTRQQAEIEIGYYQDDSAGIVIFVRDNGVGFDPAYSGKLFGVFQRLHRADEFEGTGIGLANVRRIITRHGGKTWAESEIGKGATFYFSI